MFLIKVQINILQQGTFQMINAGLIRDMLLPREKWVKDIDCKKCFDCQKQFIPLFRWRHHCRFCGNVFCSKCVDHILQGDEIDYKQQKKLRYCNTCYQQIQFRLTFDQNHQYLHKNQLYDSEENMLNLQVDQSDAGHFRKEDQVDFITFKQGVEDMIFGKIKEISNVLCLKFNLSEETWSFRLAELAWQATLGLKVDTFVRSDLFNLYKQVKIVTILTPKQSVSAVLVKGIIIQKNIPSKLFENHYKYPRILIIKPSLQAENLIKANEYRFEQMIKNESNILGNCIKKIVNLNPTIVFLMRHASKAAFEQLLEKNIMVISKVKEEDLEAIEKLSFIRKRIDNLQFIDKYFPEDLIGNCDRVYFKTIRQGEMLMFLERQSGIRSVLLGDHSPQINMYLKKSFEILLMMGWILKKQKQIILKDRRITFSIHNTQYKSLKLLNGINEMKYSNLETMKNAMDFASTKVIYRYRRLQELSKDEEAYCLYVGHFAFLEIIKNIRYKKIKIYQGEDLLLGTYLLNCKLNHSNTKKICNHLQRYFIDKYCITIKIQQFFERSSSNSIGISSYQNLYNEQLQKIQEEEDYEVKNYPEQVQIYKSIIKYFKIMQKKKEKINFLLYFKCQGCREVIGSKIKIGKEYLTVSFHHYLLAIIDSYLKCETFPFNYEERRKHQNCSHNSIVRIIELKRTMIKFYVNLVKHHQLAPILLNQSMIKFVNAKDEKMIRDLYQHEFSQIRHCIDEIQYQLSKMPFAAVSISSSFISISGIASHQHACFQYYMKMQKSLILIKQKLYEMEQTIPLCFEEPSHDWTILVRKLIKVQYTILILGQISSYIIKSLKKEKIQQIVSEFVLGSFTEESANHQYDENSVSLSRSRKYSDHVFNETISTAKLDRSTIKKSSLLASSHTSIRKESILTENDVQIDDYIKRYNKNRYILYQGIYMYFPIGNVNDPVSLLACCLNSSDFNEALKESIYKDCITIKVQFCKHLKTDWILTQQLEKLYKDLYKEEFYKMEMVEYHFSTYYNKEFEELRMHEGINFKTYIRSLYGCQNWDSSGGKSHSTFSKSHNELLVVKIINQKQFVQFQKFAPEYLKYMKHKRQKNQNSFLAKIFGIYEANIRNKIYKFVVMQNLFFGMNNIMKVYDLKGSEVNRLAMPSNLKSFTGLDTNFIIDKDGKPYILEENSYDKTIKELQEDANFLKQQSVIDYSLLIVQGEGVLRMGIIDFMRPYHLSEKIENIYKEMKSGKDPTVIPPQHYSERFISAMRKYFIKTF